MEITLIRKEFTPRATVGEMFIDGTKISDTLEDVKRFLPEKCPFTPKGKMCECSEKVYKETCISAGRYKVAYRYSPRFGKNYPAIDGVPHFLGILIHAGATVDHTEGCILVGDLISGREVLKNQFSVYKRVSEIIKKAVSIGEVWINIKEK